MGMLDTSLQSSCTVELSALEAHAAALALWAPVACKHKQLARGDSNKCCCMHASGLDLVGMGDALNATQQLTKAGSSHASLPYLGCAPGAKVSAVELSHGLRWPLGRLLRAQLLQQPVIVCYGVDSTGIHPAGHTK
jgi:hypothetical protein